MAISECAQEVKFVSIFFLEEITEVQNPSVIYEDNQSAILLAKNRQVGILRKHIGICHHFLTYMVVDKDIDIQYIRSKDNPVDIITKKTLEAYFARHMKSITEGELWELVYAGRKNVKNTRVTDDVINRDKTEYTSHALSEVLYREYENDWILVKIYRIGN